MPTPAGQAKVARNVDMGSAYSLGNSVDTAPDHDMWPARALIRQQLPPGVVYCLAHYPPFP
jgi:hypothetical protein